MKGLLSVSFGTSYEETRKKTIDAIEERLRSEFPDLPFYSAWTSERIVKKVKELRGEHHDTIAQALERMAQDGIDCAIVSTTCLMQGFETNRIGAAVDEWARATGRRTQVAKPLLYDREDRAAVARAIADEFSWVPERDALLLMGHGSPHGPNDVYPQIQQELHALGRDRFFVATVEGEPTFEGAWPLVKACGASCVYLAPLMIVAGDHATNDLAGDGDSWASRIRAEGVRAEAVLKGLGEYAGIRDLVCKHVHDALAVAEEDPRG